MKNRIILHMDLDSFFASCEIRENPSLVGKPVVIGPHPDKYGGRGVVATASYKAREYGVKSAMSVIKAYQLCPDAIFIEPNFKLYESVSSNIMKILASYTSHIEQVSIDEAYLDLTEQCGNYENTEQIAKEIKEKIKQKEGLTCSIGIGPNKVVAKIASDFRKPDGLTIVKETEVKQFLQSLPTRKLPGIGPKSELILKQLEIKTLGELSKINVMKLMSLFGRWGIDLHLLSNGIDDSPVINWEDPKSVSREVTLDTDTQDVDYLNNIIIDMADELSRYSKSNNYHFKTVAIKVRYSNFKTVTRQKSLLSASQDKNDIIHAAVPLLKKLMNSKVRLIGIRVSGITKGKQRNLSEF